MQNDTDRPVSPSILLVDDEPAVHRSVRREIFYWLAERNLSLVTAETGAQALEILADRHDSIELVVSDLKMPGMSGSDLLLEIHDRYPDIALILLTAYADVNEIRKAVSAAIQSLILKPWETGHLITEMEKALRLRELTRENRRYLDEIRDHLKTAGIFQRRLLEARFPETERLDAAVTYRPVPELYIGRDFYDLVVLGRHRYLVLVGEVAGTGIIPAFVTAMLKLMVGDYIGRIHIGAFSPAGLLEYLNDRTCRELGSMPGLFVTLAAVYLDLGAGRAVLANAGHLPVYLMRGRDCTSYRAEEAALGSASGTVFNEKHFGLEQDDLLVVFTDGLTERLAGTDTAAGDPVGEAIVMARERAVTDSAVKAGEAFNEALLILTGAASEDRRDDVTLVSVRIMPNGGTGT